MKAFKKLTVMLLALLVSAPLALFTGCGDDNGDNGGDEQTPPTSSLTPSDDLEYPENPFVAPPIEDENPQWRTPVYDTQNPEAPGSAYNRYECVEGYYSLTLSAGESGYYSFAVNQAGQYALYTLEEKTGVSITRYDASAHYISPTGVDARPISNGGLYSYAHCSTDMFNEYWRATYYIRTTADVTLKMRFVRVGEPIRKPETIVTDVYAKEIVGKAAEAETGTAPAVVPYTQSNGKPTAFYYDEDYEMTFTNLRTGNTETAKGFYRMGEEGDDLAPVIYVAITSVPSRLFESATFANVQYEGNNLSLQTGKAENGDYLVNSYVDFIMNNGGVIDNTTGKPVTGDEKAACYMNVTNSDGFYPVNKELYDFLCLYMSQNPPALAEGETVDEDLLWLTPCYYYAPSVRGSKNYPISLSTGTADIQIERAYTHVYYNLKWHGDDGKSSGHYTIISNDANAYLIVDGHQYEGLFSVTVEADTATGKTLMLSYGTDANGNAGSAGNYQLRIMETEGAYAHPYSISLTGSMVLQTQAVHNVDGEIEYISVYEYTAIVTEGYRGKVELTTAVDGVTLTPVSGVDADNSVTAVKQNPDDETDNTYIVTFLFLVESETSLESIDATLTIESLS